MTAKAHTQRLTILICALIPMAVVLQGFSTVAMAILQVLQLVIFGWVLLAAWDRGIRYHRLPGLLLMLWVVMLAVSSLVNPVSYNALNGFFHFLTIPVWYVIGVNWLDEDHDWKPVQWTIIITGLSVALYTIIQIHFLGVEAKALFAQQNTNAAFLNVVAFITAAMLISESGRASRLTRVMIMAGLLVVYYALISIAGRGALLGNLSGLIILLSVLFASGQRRQAGKILMIIVMACLASGLLNNWNIGQRFSRLGQEVVYVRSEPEAMVADVLKNSSVAERLLIWKAALEMWRQTPWYGSGFGSFHMRYPAWQVDTDTSAGQYVHNDYLQTLVEFGYPGIVLLVLLILYIGMRFCVLYFRSPRKAVKVAGIFAVLIATAVHSIVSYNLFVPVMLLLVAICSGRFMSVVEAQHSSVWLYRSRINKRFYTALVAGALVLPVAAFASTLVMNHYYERGRDLYHVDRVLEAEAAFIRAGRWFDTENIRVARALVNLSAARSMNDRTQAGYRDLMQWGVRHLQEARRMNPWLAENDYVLGLYLLEFRNVMSEKWRQEAAEAFSHALLKDRRHLESRLALSAMAEQAENYRSAQLILEQGLKHPVPDTPEIDAYLQRLINLQRRNGDFGAANHIESRLNNFRAKWRQSD